MKIKKKIIVGTALAVTGVLLIIKQFYPEWRERMDIK